MTPKKRIFAKRIAAGESPVVAVIEAGYSPARAERTAVELMSDKTVLALIRREKAHPTPHEFSSPLEFLLWLMNDEFLADRLRLRAAVALLPYVTTKPKGKRLTAADIEQLHQLFKPGNGQD